MIVKQTLIVDTKALGGHLLFHFDHEVVTVRDRAEALIATGLLVDSTDYAVVLEQPDGTTRTVSTADRIIDLSGKQR